MNEVSKSVEFYHRGSNEHSLVLRKNSNNFAQSFDSSLKLANYASKSCSVLQGNLINFDSLNNEKLLGQNYPLSCTEPIDSNEWIRKYGLRAIKLNYEYILSMIGFKQNQDYLTQFKKMVSSKYAKGIFFQTFSKDGNPYNITVDQSRLIDYVSRLEDAIKMYRMRLQWLNSGSRRLFGVITEKNVCIVLDCKQKDMAQFSQYRNCILKLLREQVAKLQSFNLIRCSNEMECFREKAVLTTSQTINEATDWLNEWNRNFIRPGTDTTTCEAVFQAFQDHTIEAVYLVSEGISSNGCREILYDRLVKESIDKRTRLNIVSFNCIDAETIEYLRRVAFNSFGPGKFHAYCLLRQVDDYVSGSIDADPTKNTVIVNQKYFGGTPPGAGVKSDLMIVFEEIQTAKETLDHLSTILDAMRKQHSFSAKSLIRASLNTDAQVKQRSNDEEYQTSKDWLSKHGLVCKKLVLFDVLNQVSFRHCDTVVDVKKEPSDGKIFFMSDGRQYFQGDAIPKEKLINAKYCEEFAHVLWNDGTIMHVHVTPELHRNYEQRMKIALSQYEKRIDWLSQGSRELFGTVIENNICLLIDTSQSMQMSLDFVKRKLAILMNEQLKSKQRFNLIAFNKKVLPWRDRMVDVDEFNMKNALEWVSSLTAQGTTNTLGAIRFALADLNVEAIYLLTDGRPDQVHLNTKIPIHTISFNCNDIEANRFLSLLARETNGRYHYYNENGWDADPDGPVPYQSEDIYLLKQEIERGLNYLSQIASLRDECSSISAALKIINLKKSTENEDYLEHLKQNKSQYNHRSKSSLSLYKSASEYDQGILGLLHDVETLDWVLPETRALLEKQFRSELKKPLKKSQENLSNRNKPVLSNDSENTKVIKNWLRKNSLSAKKLRIMDELKPSIVKSTSFKSFEKYVNSKVWNDILEFSKKSDEPLLLKHPSITDLEIYETKLINQIEIYKKFLAEKVVSVLLESELAKSLQVKVPYDWSQKEAILSALEQLNWPISKTAFLAVEHQIYLAEIFLQQSIKLRNYLQSESENSQKDTYFNKDSINENFDLNKKSTSNLLESVDESNLADRETEMKSAKEQSESVLSRGDRVIARSESLGYFFRGKVAKIEKSRHVTVEFDDGTKQSSISFHDIIKVGSTSFLTVGDFVMACVINEFEQMCWVPGIVQSIEHRTKPTAYTILYFNGQEGENLKTELLKITKKIYAMIVSYIRSRFGSNVPELMTNRTPRAEDSELTSNLPKSSTPPPKENNYDEVKKEIIEHIDSLKIDEKYFAKMEESIKLKYKQKYKEKYELWLEEARRKLLLESQNNKIPKTPAPPKSPSPLLKSPSPPPQPKPQPAPPSPTKEVLYIHKPNDEEEDELEIDEEVLAQWPDDGWYYRSKVMKQINESTYKIKDFLGDTEKIGKDCLISLRKSLHKSYEVGDPVVALHPEYEASYAPGQIVECLKNEYRIRFYENCEDLVRADEVFRISRLKYQTVIDNIDELEKRWVGKMVIVRNDEASVFEKGKVIRRIENGRKYQIELSKQKEMIIQTGNHIFGEFTRRNEIEKNNFVLAPKEIVYMPGRVTRKNRNQLTVEFVDGSIDENVEEDDCYLISREYYEDARDLY